MKSFFIYSLMTVLLFSCISASRKGLNCSINQIIINNKTTNNNLPDRVMITDTKVAAEFCKLINQKVDAGWPNVKSHSGFLEIFVQLKDKSTQNIDIIYTIYDGIVIRIGMYYYKVRGIEQWLSQNGYSVTGFS